MVITRQYECGIKMEDTKSFNRLIKSVTKFERHNPHLLKKHVIPHKILQIRQLFQHKNEPNWPLNNMHSQHN